MDFKLVTLMLVTVALLSNGDANKKPRRAKRNHATCRPFSLVRYRLTVNTFWSRTTFPKMFPTYRPHAQWSALIGRTHGPDFVLWAEGYNASDGVKALAETGDPSQLDLASTQGYMNVLDAFVAPPIQQGVGQTSSVIFLDGRHSKVSFIMKIIPSPDWFVGVSSVDLCASGKWKNTVRMDMHPMDSGTDRGLTFTSPNWPNEPREPISTITSSLPDHPASSFYYRDMEELPAIARVELEIVTEYRHKQKFKDIPQNESPFGFIIQNSTLQSEETSTTTSTTTTTSPSTTTPSTTTPFTTTTSTTTTNNTTTPTTTPSTTTPSTTTTPTEITPDNPVVDPEVLTEENLSHLSSISVNKLPVAEFSLDTQTSSTLTLSRGEPSDNEQTDKDPGAQTFSQENTPEQSPTSSDTVEDVTRKPIGNIEDVMSETQESLSSLQDETTTEQYTGQDKTTQHHVIADNEEILPNDAPQRLEPTSQSDTNTDENNEKHDRMKSSFLPESPNEDVGDDMYATPIKKPKSTNGEEKPPKYSLRELIPPRVVAETPIHCQVAEWSQWGTCSVSCSYGVRERVRDVLQMPKNGGDNCPLLRETTMCGSMRNCKWKYFSTFSDMNKSPVKVNRVHKRK